MGKQGDRVPSASPTPWRHDAHNGRHAHVFRTLGSTLDIAQREPVEILSRGVRLRAVLVSADFYQRAIEALEEKPYVLPPLSREEEPSAGGQRDPAVPLRMTGPVRPCRSQERMRC